MSNQKEIISIIKSLTGHANTLSVPRLFVVLTNGDKNCAMFLSQCVYWSDKSRLDNGWFFKTHADWEYELFMSKYEVDSARKKLARYLETKVVKAYGTPTVHYKVLFDPLVEDLQKAAEIDREREREREEEKERRELARLEESRAWSERQKSISLVKKFDYQEVNFFTNIDSKKTELSLLTETTAKNNTKTTFASQKNFFEEEEKTHIQHLHNQEENKAVDDKQELTEQELNITMRNETPMGFVGLAKSKEVAETHKARVVEVLQGVKTYVDHTGLNPLNLDGFPEDVRPMIAKVCQLWKLSPPTRGRKNGAFGYWIAGARELVDACSEFGPDLLDKIRADYVKDMRENKGIPKYTVGSPNSLVKVASARAGLERDRKSAIVDVDTEEEIRLRNEERRKKYGMMFG